MSKLFSLHISLYENAARCASTKEAKTFFDATRLFNINNLYIFYFPCRHLRRLLFGWLIGWLGYTYNLSDIRLQFHY